MFIVQQMINGKWYTVENSRETRGVPNPKTFTDRETAEQFAERIREFKKPTRVKDA